MKGYDCAGTKTGSLPKSIPIRYGGDYAIKGSSPLTWLHCNQKLRDAGLGVAVGDQLNGIYKCTQEEATDAISYNIAKPEGEIHISYETNLLALSYQVDLINN